MSKHVGCLLSKHAGCLLKTDFLAKVFVEILAGVSIVLPAQEVGREGGRDGGGGILCFGVAFYLWEFQNQYGYFVVSSTCFVNKFYLFLISNAIQQIIIYQCINIKITSSRSFPISIFL